MGKELTHLSLFSGIGGMDLAAEMAGIKTVGQCEWADYPRAVLEKHWPGLPRWRDIRTLTKESFYEQTGLCTVDIISGGFPCQPFSVAGKHRGKDDDRYLWPEMLRVIRELQPSWVIGENVPGIVNMALDTVLSDLEAEGFEVQCFLIPACGVDAPHKRERCAILAYSLCKWNGIYGTSNDVAETGRSGNPFGRREAEDDNGEWRSNKPAVCRMADGLRTAIHEIDSDTHCNGLQRRLPESVLETEFTNCSSRERERESRGYDSRLPSLVEISPFGKIGQMNPAWVEWLMGYPIGWTDLNV